MRRTHLAVFSFSFLVACPSKEDTAAETPPAIDCEWVTGENCWKDTTDPLSTCAADPKQEGVFNKDRTECTYSDGLRVVFPGPVLPLADNPMWNFEMIRGGSTCFTVETTEDVQSITTSAGTYTSETSGFSTILTCPSGDQYSMTLSSFDDCNLFDFPGTTWSWTDSSLAFGLSGTNSDVMMLFSCSDPR